MADDFYEWDADKMLDVYIHDYLLRNKLHKSANAFKTESKLPDRTPPIENTPQGFLYEWWFVYWDIYLAKRFNQQCSAPAAAYIETLKTKARERQLQMQQSQVTPKHTEQLQERDLNAMNSKGMMRPPPAIVLAAKMFEERMQHSNSMSSAASLTPMDAYRMNLPKPATSHQGQLVRDLSGNASTSVQQVQTQSGVEREVNLGGTPTSFPMDQSGFQQTMLQSDSVLGDAGNTSLPLKGLTRAGIDRPTSSLGVQVQMPNLRNKNKILDSEWQRVTARAQAILSSKYGQSDRTRLQSGSPEVNMARAQHSLSQQQGQLQQNDRKRKQSTSLGAANINVGGNRVNPSPISPPLLDTPVDGINTESSMQHVNNVPKSMIMDDINLLENMEWFAEIGTSGDNMELFQSNDGEGGNAYGTIKQSDIISGFSFAELNCIRTSNSKITCCDFSSDGKFLASAGHDKKVFIWNMETLQTEITPEDHKSVISDVRFRPNSSGLVSSSFDNVVRLWNAANPKYCVEEFSVHNSAVMSLDFHPKKTDLLCVADIESEIQYWDITTFSFIRSFKGGNAKVRFQPRVGQVLAAAYDNGVSIFDAETGIQIYALQGHPEEVNYICWVANGDILASVSRNFVKFWSLSSGEYIKGLRSSGEQYYSCVFHPSYSNILVIGGTTNIELWNLAEDKSMTIPTDQNIISCLVQSPVTGIVASASHDCTVKLWR
ncbi:PREDICTED: transcriptional corepressor LEUNIG_HOMOLOG-like isoform X2 [Lupinus angustifolius]|uniref:transcriptional corepressor LEUNIG_HOMOLOG-like isoform X2 n=1 Tax=Lupinus angustifolius TaxID=3871 RepID=UPI00092F91E3|nr:PREDICTED: transcriptional corepressor LEUNIG_HOMOLOG-like isoform X2 [Lupinus angustifolius]